MATQAKQLLPKDCYLSSDWYERECRTLFDQSWVYACVAQAVSEPGDFVTLQFMQHSLFVVRNEAGELAAFHNICRHRGCQVLEGQGNTSNAIVCPYHRWTYQLDGALRGVPNETECFDEVDRGALSLHQASVGESGGMIFVNPSPNPKDNFDEWIAGFSDHMWPHKFGDGSMQFSGEVVYEMHCNWKLFYENAIDGYHLGYLHDQTLGKVYPDVNEWDLVGRHHVWYSTEWGERRSNTVLSVEGASAYGTPTLHPPEEAHYPGVVMLFPLTILSPSPWGFYISILEPKGPELTLMRTLAWSPSGDGGRFKFDDSPQVVKLVDLDKHPLETGNFQIEDMWIVEKIQKTLHSPLYEVGPLATGVGAESPITEFQQQVLEFVPLGT